MCWMSRRLWLAGQAPLRYNSIMVPSGVSAVACGEAPLRYKWSPRQPAWRGRCGLRGIVARIHCPTSHPSAGSAVACGESSLGYTTLLDSSSHGCRCGLRGIVARIHSVGGSASRMSGCGLRGIVARIHSAIARPRFMAVSLWLAGNRRSDTLQPTGPHAGLAAVACGESSLRYTAPPGRSSDQCRCGLRGIVAQVHLTPRSNSQQATLWLAGNRRSGTLAWRWRATAAGCGLRGIAAQVHWPRCGRRSRDAVACGESPLRYTCSGCPPVQACAVACGESPLRYTPNAHTAVMCWRCGLRGIVAQVQSGRKFASAPSAVACGESPLRYTIVRPGARVIRLWLAGNRRSGTLVPRDVHHDRPCCGLRGIVAQVHLEPGGPRLLWLWLAGNRRSGTLDIALTSAIVMLWLAGNRRSDTLATGKAFQRWRCGLRGIVAQIQSVERALSACAGCGLRGIVARVHSLRTCRRAGRAVACGESPLRYTPGPFKCVRAVACGESPLRIH